ncbi:hypothetical protein BC941DRAFT_82653 [Chlamydoabsidia padenii]|nr:hypothetical protein BC941DRAFT_82653 [Chlamydoabsidia padenii]
MVYMYSDYPLDQVDFDTRYHPRQPSKSRFSTCKPSRQSTFKRQDRQPFIPESYTTWPYYMDKEERDDMYEQPYNYVNSPEMVLDDSLLDNDYDMDTMTPSWTRRPQRRSSLTLPHSDEWNELPRRHHYASHTRQRQSSNIPTRYSQAPHYLELDRRNYDYDQDDDCVRSDRRNSLQHYRRHHQDSSSTHWSPVMGSASPLPQHRQSSVVHHPRLEQAPCIDTPPYGQMSFAPKPVPPPLLPMPQPMIPPPPAYVPHHLLNYPIPFHPMMMMMPQPTFFPDTKPAPTPQPASAPSSPTLDQAKRPSSAPDDTKIDSSTSTKENALIPLARSLSLGTSQPRRRSLFGSLFHMEGAHKSSDASLIPVQDLTTRSLSRKQSLSLEKKAKALSQRSYIWCYRIKPSILAIQQPSGCWFAMTPRNQIKLDPYLGFYQQNAGGRPENLPTLVTLDKEPKLTGSVTAMPQAKIARVYPSIFSSSNYIELVLDCLPADSQFVVRSD